LKALFAWFGAHPLRPALVSIVAILALGSAAAISGPARADRNWYPYLGRDVEIEAHNGAFTVTPVSDWRYVGAEVAEERYFDASFDLSALRNVWFVLEPQPGSTLAAHTLLLFEFENDALIGLTIEARREVGEEYDALAGVFNAFELAYVWGTARDFLTRRAVMLDHEVFVYPVAISDEQKLVLLTRLIERTDALERTPRYYNTILSNCTNELAKAAGFDWAPAFILTGRSDEYLYERGVLPGASFEQAHRRSDMTEFIQALNQAPPEAFDAALLVELRRRNGM
jgi:Domain of unknown function (DUF4105)